MKNQWDEKENIPEQPVRGLTKWSKIKRDPHQPRKHFDQNRLKELKQSIQRVGVLEPLKVMRISDKPEQFLLIDGERRHRSIELLIGNQKKDFVVPVIVYKKAVGLELDLLRFTIHHQREDWTPIEQAKKLKEMRNIYHLTPRELADKTGLSEGTVRNYLDIDKLPEKVKEIADKEKLKISYLTEMRSIAKKVSSVVKEKFPNIEELLVEKIRTKAIINPLEIRHLKKVFERDIHWIIEKFFNGKISAEEAYHESGLYSKDFEAGILNSATALGNSIREAIKYNSPINTETREALLELSENITWLLDHKATRSVAVNN